MPRPGYRSPGRGGQLIPPGWDAHHKPVADAQMTATGRIVERIQGPFDRATNTHQIIWQPVWPTDGSVVPLRLQQLNRGDGDVEAGEQRITGHDYRCSLDRSVDVIQVERHWVEVADSTDTQLVGQHLKVIDVQYGTLRWQRDLIAVADLG